MKQDFFVRFKYNLEEVFSILNSASGAPLKQLREAYDILIDFGFWEYLGEASEENTTENFEFTPELKSRLEAQFKYLSQVYNQFSDGENVWIYNTLTSSYEEAQIIEQTPVFDTDFYVVKTISEKQTFIFTHNELNQWNSPSCTLPQDELLEKIDWDNDFFWQKKIGDFQRRLKRKDLMIDFRQSNEIIIEKQTQIVKEIISYFQLNSELAPQKNRGIGFRACGGGTISDASAIYTLVVQAIGHTLGIKAIFSPEEHFRIEIKNNETQKNQNLYFVSLKNMTYEVSTHDKLLTHETPLTFTLQSQTFGLNKISHLQEVSECVIATGPLFTEKLQNILHVEENMRNAIIEVYKNQKSLNKVFALEEAILSKQDHLMLNVQAMSSV